MKRFASYGSLRKGFWNHDRFGLGEPIATSTIRGKMFVNPNLGYPYLFSEPFEKEYKVEIYEVSESVYQMIDGMEQGSGYYPEQVLFDVEIDGVNVIEATVWFADKSIAVKDEWFVEDYKLKN